MRIGLVCPYAWYVPGGVQAHVRDFAEALLGLGHEVSVIAPADEDDEGLPAYVVPAGRAVPLPYNGSVARLTFGPLSNARVRRWLREGAFDVLHVHEPTTPSLSLLALFAANGPIVATFHSSVIRSRLLHVLQNPLQPALEKIGARIAVSEAARRTVIDHGGGDVVVIPNGVHVADFEGVGPLAGFARDGRTIGFLGRFDEPRKGFPLLREAFLRLVALRPDVRLLVAGRGDEHDALGEFPEAVRPQVTFLGMVDDGEKARFLNSLDVYVAPNTGGESFGIILLEAAASSAPIVASDLDAFRAVLDDGDAGELFPVGDVPALTTALDRLLADAGRREELVQAGLAVARRLDWAVIAQRVLAVYDTVTHGETVVVSDERPARA